MFDKATRTLIVMLFERGTINEVDGILEDGRRWSVTKHGPSLFCDYVFYSGWLCGEYREDFRGDSAEETLGKMNAWLAEDEAIKAEIQEVAL